MSEIKINRQPVDSSAILEIGYSEEYKILEVEFQSGHVKRYINVPPGEYNLLMESGSIGRYFNAFIKGTYEQASPEIPEKGN